MRHHLLAGGSGFIGSHLADHFVGAGDRVTVVDNFSTGRRANLAALEGNPALRVIEHDITAPLPAEVTDQSYDCVLDFASPASPEDFKRMPLEILAVGSTGSRHLLDLAHHQGARFMLASTSEVYGDPLVHPQPESYWGNVSSTGPRSCYDEAKRFSEALTMAYHRTLGVDVRIARIFNTYGERMAPRDGRVVNTLLVQALRREPLTVFGNGEQTRSFCHVSDEVRGLVAVLDGPTFLGPVNVGNPAEVTMRELAEVILELTGAPGPIVALPLPPEREGDPARRCPDITLARDTLGWEPTVPLREGVRRMIAWFRDHEDV